MFKVAVTYHNVGACQIITRLLKPQLTFASHMEKNSLSYETVSLLFDPDAEAGNGGSWFRINGGATFETMKIPTSMMHRLFRLVQAYGIRHDRRHLVSRSVGALL